MKEDLAFYNLLKHSDGLDEETIDHIKEFRETFKGTKTATRIITIKTAGFISSRTNIIILKTVITIRLTSVNFFLDLLKNDNFV